MVSKLVPDIIKDMKWCPYLITKSKLLEMGDENNYVEESYFMGMIILTKAEYDIYEQHYDWRRFLKKDNLYVLGKFCDGCFDFVVKNATYAKIILFTNNEERELCERRVDFVKGEGEGEFTLPDFTKSNPLINLIYFDCFVETDGDLSSQIIFFNTETRDKIVRDGFVNVVPSLNLHASNKDVCELNLN